MNPSKGLLLSSEIGVVIVMATGLEISVGLWPVVRQEWTNTQYSWPAWLTLFDGGCEIGIHR